MGKLTNPTSKVLIFFCPEGPGSRGIKRGSGKRQVIIMEETDSGRILEQKERTCQLLILGFVDIIVIALAISK